MIKNSSLKPRIIARLDMRGEYLIKGIYYEGLRKLGRPENFANRYYNQGVDELVCIDGVASLFNRKISYEVIKKISKNAFIPLTVGGGLNNLKDVEKCFLAGCDRVTINTGLIKNLKLASQIVKNFGSQALQASIQVKK